MTLGPSNIRLCVSSVRHQSQRHSSRRRAGRALLKAWFVHDSQSGTWSLWTLVTALAISDAAPVFPVDRARAGLAAFYACSTFAERLRAARASVLLAFGLWTPGAFPGGVSSSLFFLPRADIVDVPTGRPSQAGLSLTQVMS